MVILSLKSTEIKIYRKAPFFHIGTLKTKFQSTKQNMYIKHLIRRSFIAMATLACLQAFGSGFHKKIGFVENKGQLNHPEIAYYGKRDNLNLYLKRDGSILYQLEEIKNNKIAKNGVLISFLNHNENFKIIHHDQNVAKISFFKESGEYHSKNYRKITYQNIYNNIDLVYYFDNASNFKYDFIVKPGGNPNDIKIQYSGQKNLKLDASSNLKISTQIGSIVEQAPYVYQETSKEVVNASYNLLDDVLTFNVHKYDPSKTLVIDPLIEFTRILGGDDDDFVEQIKTDDSGNIYLVGHTNSDNMPLGDSAFQDTADALKDVYIAKMDSSANLLWATYYGSNDEDIAKSVTIGDEGAILIVGHTNGITFPASERGTSDSEGGLDVFLLKFSPDGEREFGGLFGGDGDDEANDVIIPEVGEYMYIVGGTSSERFGVGDPKDLGEEGYIYPIDKDPNLSTVLQFDDIYVGGNLADEIFGVTLDNEGFIVVVGRTSSDQGIQVGDSVFQTNFMGGEDMFIGKINPVTGQPVWITYFGSFNDEWAEDVEVDSDNNYIVVGYTTSPNFPVTNGTTYGGGTTDGVILKLDSDGKRIWSSFLGGNGSDRVESVKVGSNNNIYTFGYTESTDFPIVGNAIQSTNKGGFDAMLTAHVPDGGILYSTYFGGNENDFGKDISALRDSLILYMVGETESDSLAETNINNQGGLDYFISKLDIFDIGCEIVADSNTITASIDETCLNTEVTISGTDLIAILGDSSIQYQYQVSIDGGNWTDVSQARNSVDYTDTLATVGEYRFRRIVLSRNSLCSDTSDAVSIIVSDIPISNNEITFDNGNSITLSQCEDQLGPVAITGTDATAASGSINYQYVLFNENTQSFENIANATDRDLDFIVSSLNPGMYSIGRFAISDEVPSCRDLDTITLTIDSIQVTNNTISTTRSVICTYEVAQIDGLLPNTSSSFDYVYLDSIPGGEWDTIPVGSTEDLQYDLEDNESVFIRRDIVVDNPNTCEYESNVLELNQDFLTVSPFNVNPTQGAIGFCENDALQFTDITPADQQVNEWDWSFGDGGTSDLQNPVYSYDAGSYTAQLIVTSVNDCKDTTSRQLVINSNPTVTVDVADTLILEFKESVSLLVTASTSDSVIWIPTGDLLNTMVLQPILSATMDEVYTITVFDENKCSAQDSVTIILDDEAFFIPSAFTPNDDGFNDRFEIIGISRFPAAKMDIYNRWGVKVFESNDLINNSWDGTHKGEDTVPEGVYYYKLELKNGNTPIDGTITLLK